MDVFGASLRRAQIVQRPVDHPISRSRVAALVARSSPIIPRPQFDPWLRQVLDPLNPLRGVRDILSGSRHVITLSLCLVYRRPSPIPEGKSRQNRYSLTIILVFRRHAVCEFGLVEVLGYRRRKPEESLLYRVVQENLETFFELAAHRSGGKGLPTYVRQEFERYMDCGILANGFARVRCAACGYNGAVGFSCKGIATGSSTARPGRPSSQAP